MSHRAVLHRIVDCLSEEELPDAGKALAELATADPVERALLLAPEDDEADFDDADGGLTEARRELARGEGIGTEELEREFGIGQG